MSLANVPVRPADKEKVRGRKPRRVQRTRTKGQRLPRTAIFVGRGTPFGNGWKIGDDHPETSQPMTRRDVIDLHRQGLAGVSPDTIARIRGLLRGHDLACWCPLDKACHADLLLTIANATSGEEVWDALHPELPASSLPTEEEARAMLEDLAAGDEPADEDLPADEPDDLP
jgi:hypothetical protein